MLGSQQFHLIPLSEQLPENETSRFVHLGFAGQGKLQSLIAVFENGKVFGIEDFSAEKICSLAANEPNSLSVAMRKMKFLKSSLAVDFPLSKAAVYIGPSRQASSIERSTCAETKVVEVPLSIALISGAGDLLTCSIGSTAALQNATPTSILKELKKSQSYLSNIGCIDMAILPFSQNRTEIGSGCGILAALHTDNSLSLIDLSSSVILKMIRLDSYYSSATRISLVSSVIPPDTAPRTVPNKDSASSQEESEWSSVIIGLEISSNVGTSNQIISIISSTHNKNSILAVKLGMCDEMSEDYISSSLPGDIVFQAGRKNCTGGTGGYTTGYTLSDSMYSCVNSITKGIDTRDVPSDDSAVSPIVTDDVSCTALHVLVGRIMRLSIGACNGDGEGEGDVGSAANSHLLNPFGAEELLDQALEMMTSLSTCGEIGVVLNTLIVCVSDPAAGFVDRAIATAEVRNYRDPTSLLFLSLLISNKTCYTD
jgi:hypothetical protein